MDIYIIEYYPGGWIKCEQIDEEKVINKYGYAYAKSIAFDRFYFAIKRGFQQINSDGYPLWFGNNCTYVVVEGKNPIEAVSKACDVINVWKKDIINDV